MKCVDMNTLEEILKVCRPQHHWNYQKEFGRDDRSLKKGHFYHGVFQFFFVVKLSLASLGVTLSLYTACQ